MIKELKPSDFSCKDPMGSIAQKSEAETIVRNVMAVLHRTGNNWRELTLEEYKQNVSEIDKRNICGQEEDYFERYAGFAFSADKALLFCPHWLNKKG